MREFWFLPVLLLCNLQAEGFVLNIVGGQPAEKGEFPWMASVQMIATSKHLCGSSILNSTYLVTAGHCVSTFWPEDLRVVAGTLNIFQPESTQQTRNIVRISIHPNYENTDGRVRNDLAMLEVYPPFEMDQDVNSIELPPIPQHSATGFCWIAGWGKTETAPESDILLKAVLPIVQKHECGTVYNERLDKETQICAGYAQGGTDVCFGDTGGPLICSDTGNYYLAGISSWGYKCAEPNYPGVYTEVSYYTRNHEEEPRTSFISY